MKKKENKFKYKLFDLYIKLLLNFYVDCSNWQLNMKAVAAKKYVIKGNKKKHCTHRSDQGWNLEPAFLYDTSLD
jgi:hypothetical protein